MWAIALEVHRGRLQWIGDGGDGGAGSGRKFMPWKNTSHRINTVEFQYPFHMVGRG